MSWLAVRVKPGPDRERALAALFQAGAGGVQEDGESLLTHFPPGTDPEELHRALDAASPGAQIDMGLTPMVDWSEAWKLGMTTRQAGALAIAPPWLADGLDAARTIVIDPGMAFGTGDHATTRGALVLLQKVVRAGDHVADLGAGSAILAIGAAKLGAASVAAVELDFDAIENAEENVSRNGVERVVRVIEGDAATLLPLLAPVRVIIANILSSVLTGFLPLFREALAEEGCAVLSGILVSEREEFISALQSDGWRVLDEIEEGDWWSVTAAPL